MKFRGKGIGGGGRGRAKASRQKEFGVRDPTKASVIAEERGAGERLAGRSVGPVGKGKG